MTEHQQTIVLAALLYDLGRFCERTGRPLTAKAEKDRAAGQHGFEPFSAMLIDDLPVPWAAIRDALRRLVLNSNHPTSADERLIHLAYNISTNQSASQEPTPAPRRPNNEPALQRVLARARPKGVQSATRLYEPLIPFPLKGGLTDPKSLLDNRVDTLSGESYRALWDSFLQELQRTPLDISTMLALLKKYTWAVPWDPRKSEDADVSLYAQSKATAAVAACLLMNELGDTKIQLLDDAFTDRRARNSSSAIGIHNEPLFALVKGDVSGTQDFLYLLTSSGAARGLRGRSFFLQLLTEAVAAWLLRYLDMPATNLLFAGGGHFYLLLPHQKTAAELPTLRREITRKLWEAYGGDLSMAVDFVGVSAREFVDAFATKWGEVSERVNERKRQRLSDFGDDVLKQFLEPKQLATTTETTCAICHGEWREDRDREDEGIRKCNRCEGFEILGIKLRKPVSLVSFTVPDADRTNGGDWSQVLRSFGADVRLFEEGAIVPGKPDAALAVSVTVLDSADFLTEQILGAFQWDSLHASYDFRFFPNATPYAAKDQITEFEDLAKASKGAKWLGVLRMDVDSLGDIFKHGLNPRATIARISTLSDSLRIFFEGWAPNLCRQFNAESERGGQVYLIYAGGDDLFVVGSWSALPDLAKKIRDDFRSFVGGDHVSLSGGIAIEHQKYPVYQLANDAKHALDDRAKEFRRNHGRRKDALTFLQATAGWEQFEPIAEWKDKLIAMLKPANGGKALPRGFLTRLGEIHYLYEENARYQRQRRRKEEISLEEMKEEIRYAKWVWRLVYQLGRFREAHEDFRTEIGRFQAQIILQNLVERLNVIARWTELLTREEKE